MSITDCIGLVGGGVEDDEGRGAFLKSRNEGEDDLVVNPADDELDRWKVLIAFVDLDADTRPRYIEGVEGEDVASCEWRREAVNGEG
jgi:hypothetical protein